MSEEDALLEFVLKWTSISLSQRRFGSGIIGIKWSTRVSTESVLIVVVITMFLEIVRWLGLRRVSLARHQGFQCNLRLKGVRPPARHRLQLLRESPLLPLVE